MNTYECEYNTVETYELTVLRIGLLDSGLVQLKEKNGIFCTLSQERIKLKGGEDYVKDRKSESGHYVIPTGKVSEDPPPLSLRQR